MYLMQPKTMHYLMLLYQILSLQLLEWVLVMEQENYLKYLVFVIFYDRIVCPTAKTQVGLDLSQVDPMSSFQLLRSFVLLLD